MPDSDIKKNKIMGYAFTIFFLGGVHFFLFALILSPEFIQALGMEECTSAENPKSFEEATIDECAQLTGVAFGPLGEYTTIEVEGSGMTPTLLKYQETVENATKTDFDLIQIIPGTEIPKEIAGFQDIAQEIEDKAVLLSKGEEVTLAESVALLDRLKEQGEEFDPWMESNQRFFIDERSKIDDYSGPNPTHKPISFDWEPPSLAINPSSYVLGNIQPSCALIEDQITEMKAIKEQLQLAYQQRPPKKNEYKEWPKIDMNRYRSCVLKEVPDFIELAMWYDLETNRKNIYDNVLGNQELRIQTYKGKKVQLPNHISGQVLVLDITKRPLDRSQLLWVPLLVVLGVINLLIGLAIRKRQKS